MRILRLKLKGYDIGFDTGDTDIPGNGGANDSDIVYI